MQGQTRRPSRRDVSQGLITERGKPNVFAYMEEGIEEEEVDDGAGASALKYNEKIDAQDTMRRNNTQNIVLPAAPMSPNFPGDSFVLEEIKRSHSARASSIASLHSDSGISVRGVSPDSSPALGNKRPYSRNLIPKGVDLTRTTSVSSMSSISSRKSVSEEFDQPESFYTMPKSNRSATGKTSQQIQVRSKRQPAYSSEKRGYDLLASRISTTDQEIAKPIYRRFEALNNRILLIMQDEIVTMEKDLAIIDRQIADLDGPLPSPASRRAELRAPTPIQWQRMQICGILIPKLGQYNRTLASYQSVTQISSTSEDQIKLYKELIEQHQPLVSSETAFLDEFADLVTVSALSISRVEQQKISYELGAALFFLILAFKLIPSLLGRMILGVFLVASLSWSGRLPADDAVVAGILGPRVGM